MNNLIDFLTSKDIVIVYIVAGVLLTVCFIVYLVQRSKEKRRLRSNTRELNKLVEEIKDETSIEDESISYDEPVIESIIEENVESKSVVSEMLDDTFNNNDVRDEVIVSTTTPSLYEVSNVVLPDLKKEESIESIVIDNSESVSQTVVEDVSRDLQLSNVVTDRIKDLEEDSIDVSEDTLEYTTIEPDPVTAQLELKKITEELRRQEEADNNIIGLTSYEEEQEENAIISLDELVNVGKDIYEKNELNQYSDEGNEPISLQELEKIGMKNSMYEEPFVIEKVVDENEVVEDMPIRLDEVLPADVSETVNYNNGNSHKFKSSPVISPIYGIEGMENNNSGLELENTANYEKLDAEIKKTNEFLMTLKELQKNLD